MARKSQDDEEEQRARFEALYVAHHRAVRRYALRRIDPAAVDDVVNETFVVAWRRLDAIPGDALPWLFGVARRVLANQRRGDARRLALVDRIAMSASPEVEQVDDDALALRFGPELIRAALERLSERDRELLTLVYWDGLDGARAAAALGRSHVSVRVALTRARARLQRLLEDDELTRAALEVSDVAAR